MGKRSSNNGMVMRLFQVVAKADQAQELLRKFSTTSADVVQNEPGNKGYFFGQGIAVDENIVIFASFWRDLDDIKQRFGEDWQVSFLPEGYEEHIQECTLQHIDVSTGWFVEPQG